jgi:iron complex outermembrane receptor protein
MSLRRSEAFAARRLAQGHPVQQTRPSYARKRNFLRVKKFLDALQSERHFSRDKPIVEGSQMRSFRAVLIGTACVFSSAGTAWAQETLTVSGTAAPAPTDVAGADGDIVVTAQRRNERLQDVPVSITALSGDQLADKRIASPTDLVSSVPNLQAASTVGEGIPVFSLRGISMSDYSINQQGPVATYIDDVYKGTFPLLPVALYDLERVEVLRGPQGTLYGKNTTGGAINIISRRPGFSTEGYLAVGIGNYQRYEANGALQAALSDKVAARVAFTFARADGWFKNRLPGQADANATRQYAVRVSLLAQPTDRLQFLLRLSTSLQNPTNYGIFARPAADGIGAGAYELFGGSSYFRTGIGRRELESEYAERRRHRTYGASLTTNWKATDDLTVTSVTSYDYGKLFIPEDADGSPLKAVEDDLGGRARQFSQDLRIASDFDNGLDFIAGAYYSRETISAQTTYSYFTDIDVTRNGVIDAEDCTQDFLTSCMYSNRYHQRKSSAAVYADVNYALFPRLIARAGLRYTRDTGRISGYNARVLGADGTPIANTIPGDPVDFDATASDGFRKGTVTGRAGVDYKLPGGNLLYASYSRGYRASAFNAQAYFLPTELNVAKPETVNAFEVGFKSQFFGRAVTFNGSAFYYAYKNQQALSIDPDTVAQTLVNIPTSRMAGAEFELSARPAPHIRLNAGLGLLSTKIRTGTISGVVLAGNRLPNAPSVSLTAGAEWDVIDTDGGKLTLGVDGNHNSKQYFELMNEDRIAQKGYVVVNGRVAYRSGDGQYGIAAWAKNLFNRYYFRSSIDVTGFGFDFFQVGEPRTYGITADMKF